MTEQDTQTLRERMRRFMNASDEQSPEQLAVSFMKKLAVSDLLPLVVAAFRDIQRERTRRLEIDALHAIQNGNGRRHSVSVDDLKILLDREYRIGDGIPRTFGQLTIEEHMTRIQMLSAQRAGLTRDIELHERAIQFIRKHGVSCIDEIGEHALAA